MSGTALRITRAIAPLALIGFTAAAQAGTTAKVDCRSTYLLASEYDNGMPAPTKIRLADLGIGAGDVLILTEKGKFSQAKSWPEDTDVVGAVFSRDDRFLARTERHRIPGALRAGPAIITPNENSKGYFTDISEDFAVAPTGTRVVVPSGAQYLFLAAVDSYYADNTSTNGLTVDVTVAGTSSNKGRNLLKRLLPASLGLASGATSVAANGTAAGWVGKSGVSQAAMFKNGNYASSSIFGGSAATAYAIDSNGDLVGSALTKAGETHPFIASGSSITEPTNDAGEALAMNPRGTVVGYKNIWGGFYYPFATVKGKAELIDTNWCQGVATGINASDDVVGYGIGLDRKPIAWISEGNQKSRVAVPLSIPANFGAYPVAINDKGQIVGNYVVGNYATDKPYRQAVHAFVFDAKGFRDLGTLGGDSVEATAINNKGQIVGSATTAEGEVHAFLYDGGKMTDLGTLDGNVSVATAISDSGIIVGTALDANGNCQAFSSQGATVATATGFSGLSLSSNYFPEGSTVTGTITLNAAAPAGGLTVTLAANKSGVVTIPTTVTVAAGQTTATFPIKGNAAEANTPFTITASALGQTAKSDATVRSLTLNNLKLSSYTPKANTTLTGSFQLESAALSGGKTIKVSADNAAVTVPATVALAAGTQNGNFTVKVGAVAAGTKVTLTFQCGDRVSRTTFTVN